jgi:hypothetical protein
MKKPTPFADWVKPYAAAVRESASATELTPRRPTRMSAFKV